MFSGNAREARGRLHSGLGAERHGGPRPLLGQLPGFCSVGELRSLWDCDPVSLSCSVAASMREYELSAPSLREALGGVIASGFATIRDLHDRASRSRDAPSVGHGRLCTGPKPDHPRIR